MTPRRGRAGGRVALLVVAAMGDPLRRAARNVPWLTVVTPGHVSVYQLMQARHVVFERAALTRD